MHYIFDGVSESHITFNGCLIFPLHFRVRWQWGPCLAAPGQKCGFWKVLGLARNPSKKMRLDESFRMVQFSCQSEVTIESHGQNKVIPRHNFGSFLVPYFGHRFWDTFWSLLGSILGQFWGAKLPPKWIPSKTRRILGLLRSPGCFQGSFDSGRHLEASGDHFESSEGHFGTILRVQQQQKKQKEVHQTKAQ